MAVEGGELAIAVVTTLLSIRFSTVDLRLSPRPQNRPAGLRVLIAWDTAQSHSLQSHGRAHHETEARGALAVPDGRKS